MVLLQAHLPILGLLPARLAAILSLAVLLAACFVHPGVAVWAANERTSEVILLYSQDIDRKAFLIPANSSGFVGFFDAPVDPSSFEALDAACHRIGSIVNGPKSGGLSLIIGADTLTAAATFLPSYAIAFKRVESCASPPP